MWNFIGRVIEVLFVSCVVVLCTAALVFAANPSLLAALWIVGVHWSP